MLEYWSTGALEYWKSSKNGMMENEFLEGGENEGIGDLLLGDGKY